METVGSDAALRALREALSESYAIERELGRGGMATVYLARDLRHRRAVAVKVLHPELSAALGPERFLKEIELTASLQHPHILPLFDSGSAGASLYYVMPYVDGESLRGRLARERQLGIDEAVRITREVASALDYAHRRGVIHRDIKPENILLHDGAALVADFGIALAVAHASGERITQTGFSLGTPQYMAPEQAMGERTIDARADVYALGVVLYEMLSGEPPFTGPTAQAVVARVMTDRPRSLAALRETVPPHIEAAVMTALAKLPADRFATAAAFASALATGVATPVAGAPSWPTARSRRWRAATPFVVGALAVAAAIGWGLALSRGRPAAAPAASSGRVRFAIDVDSGAFGGVGWWISAPVISPDGRTIVYSASGPTGVQLYARRVDEIAARPLAGTEDADWPFFSPDGAWVGFVSRGVLRKVQLSGGSPITVTQLRAQEHAFGADWGSRDTLIYSVFRSGVLYRVSAAGGTPTRIAVEDTSRRLAHPHRLPDGRSLLVTVTDDSWAVGRIGVLDLATGRLRVLGPGSNPQYLAGHLFFTSAAGELYRQTFDLDALTPRGSPEEIASGLDVVFAANAAFDVSSTGTLVYRASAGRSRLTLTDRAGREQSTLPGSIPWEPQFSPDGRRIAYVASGPGPGIGDVWAGEVFHADIWIADVASGATQRVTTDGRDNGEPRWSRDGSALVHTAARRAGDKKDIFVQKLDGAEARLLVGRPGLQWSSDVATDGRALLFIDELPGGWVDIWVQPLDSGPPRPYLATAAVELYPRLSPDGRLVAYSSNESGRDEVYVQSYPTPGRPVLISTGGGVRPVWRRDGSELYYWKDGELIAVQLRVRQGELPEVRSRSTLFRSASNPIGGYDVSPDGNRFAIVTGAPRAKRLVVALDALGAVSTRPRTVP